MQLPELNTLVLTRNRIAKLRPATLAGCTALAKLSLSHNALADLGGEKLTRNGPSMTRWLISQRIVQRMSIEQIVQRTSVDLEAAVFLSHAGYCSSCISRDAGGQNAPPA